MRHVFGFGNTMERYDEMCVGTKARGNGRYDHKTGKGRVEKHKGHYHDALHNKRSTLIVNLVEATGGLSPPSAGRVWRLARRANVKGARDGTRYGKLRISPKSFVVHHVQRISMAAVIGDAGNINQARTKCGPASLRLCTARCNPSMDTKLPMCLRASCCDGVRS